MSAHPLSLRDRQIGTLQLARRKTYTRNVLMRRPLSIASIQKILNLNHDPLSAGDTAHDGSAHGLISHTTPILNEDGDPIWKILVFDNMGRDVISSVLRVNDLRAWGVTIHL